ncbi:hypothetical protein T492DRAFT_309120 [Pavlovales sp. CCMP2436]|nr:hypothetical protein T492DRAFT_309120 [Pavlovales sp. CCMP2436]
MPCLVLCTCSLVDSRDTHIVCSPIQLSDKLFAQLVAAAAVEALSRPVQPVSPSSLYPPSGRVTSIAAEAPAEAFRHFEKGRYLRTSSSGFSPASVQPTHAEPSSTMATRRNAARTRRTSIPYFAPERWLQRRSHFQNPRERIACRDLPRCPTCDLHHDCGRWRLLRARASPRNESARPERALSAFQKGRLERTTAAHGHTTMGAPRPGSVGPKQRTQLQLRQQRAAHRASATNDSQCRVPQDFYEAAQQYRVAADHGHAMAQCCLAMCYLLPGSWTGQK